MSLSRSVLALLGALQLLVACTASGTNPWSLVGKVLLVSGAVLSLTCAAVPTRPLAIGCVGLNFGVCAFFVGMSMSKLSQNPEAVAVVRIACSAPLCSALLAGWLGVRWPW